MNLFSYINIPLLHVYYPSQLLQFLFHPHLLRKYATPTCPEYDLTEYDLTEYEEDLYYTCHSCNNSTHFLKNGRCWLNCANGFNVNQNLLVNSIKKVEYQLISAYLSLSQLISAYLTTSHHILISSHLTTS